jgi:hypothetical protein
MTLLSNIKNVLPTIVKLGDDGNTGTPIGQLGWGKSEKEDDNEVAKSIYNDRVAATFKNYLQEEEFKFNGCGGQKYHQGYLYELDNTAFLDNRTTVEFHDENLDGIMNEGDDVYYTERNKRGEITFRYQDTNFNSKHDEGEFAVYNTYDYDNKKSTSWQDRNGNGKIDEGDLVTYYDENTSGTVMKQWWDWNLNGVFDDGDWGYFGEFDQNGKEIASWNNVYNND